MSHESLERNETVKGSSNRTLGLTFAAVFLIIGLWPWIFGGTLRLWSIGVSVAFAMAGSIGGNAKAMTATSL